MVLAVIVIGCAPKIVSSEGGVYQNGSLYAMSDKNTDAVYNAALHAMDMLQLKVTDKMKDAFGAKVIAKSSDDKKIEVEIKPTKDNKTMYNIHVGAFGDEERSRMIYSEMDKNLMGQK
jgi:hypothetical protein